MFNLQLINQKAKFYSNFIWNQNLNVNVIYNKKFKNKSLGKAKLLENIIQLSQYVENELLLDDILIHELTHFYCFKNGKEYCDGFLDFENELIKIGITSTNMNIDKFKPSEQLIKYNKEFYDSLKI